MHHIAKMTQLKRLNIDNTKVADEGLEPLVALTQLEFLHLGRTKISDLGLEQLKKITSLKHLIVTRCSLTTAEGVDSLRKALPECKIEWP